MNADKRVQRDRQCHHANQPAAPKSLSAFICVHPRLNPLAFAPTSQATPSAGAATSRSRPGNPPAPPGAIPCHGRANPSAATHTPRAPNDRRTGADLPRPALHPPRRSRPTGRPGPARSGPHNQMRSSRRNAIRPENCTRRTSLRARQQPPLTVASGPRHPDARHDRVRFPAPTTAGRPPTGPAPSPRPATPRPRNALCSPQRIRPESRPPRTSDRPPAEAHQCSPARPTRAPAGRDLHRRPSLRPSPARPPPRQPPTAIPNGTDDPDLPHPPRLGVRRPA
jgi:hypothetical protein